MGIFERGDEAAIFRNENVLLPEYLPDQIIDREKEMNEIVSALRPILEKRKATNLFIYGPSGTGKTTIIKYIIKEFEKEANKVFTKYINCWESATQQAVLSDIGEKLNVFLPRRGLAPDEIFRRILEVMKKNSEAGVVILDEADQIFNNKEEGILYRLARAKEINGAEFHLILISNSIMPLISADERIRSSCAFEKIEFKKYSPMQLKKILKERAEIAFVKDVCSEEVISICAARAAKSGSARIALEMLWKAGKNAENEGSNKIMRKHINTQQNESIIRVKKKLELLNKEQLKLLKLIKNKPISSGEIYKKVPNSSERTIRSYLKHLEELKLIKAEEINNRGRTRIFSLNFNPDLI